MITLRYMRQDAFTLHRAVYTVTVYEQGYGGSQYNTAKAETANHTRRYGSRVYLLTQYVVVLLINLRYVMQVSL